VLIKGLNEVSDLRHLLMTLDEEAIIRYEETGEYWEFFKDYLYNNFRNDFTFHYIEPNTTLRNLAKTAYAFYIAPKSHIGKGINDISKIDKSPILFDIKDLNI
jgi:hypothetical protein